MYPAPPVIRTEPLLVIENVVPCSNILRLNTAQRFQAYDIPFGDAKRPLEQR